MTTSNLQTSLIDSFKAEYQRINKKEIKQEELDFTVFCYKKLLEHFENVTSNYNIELSKRIKVLEEKLKV